MIRACSACGKSNRIPADKLHLEARCGACKASLPPMAEPADVDESEFREIVAQARVPVLIDFWAEWCGPCRMAAPAVKGAAAKLQGRAVVLKVNTDMNQKLAAEFGIRGIPNFAIMKDGAVVMQQAGLVDQRTLESWLVRAGA